jgi:HEAT repeat protein
MRHLSEATQLRLQRLFDLTSKTSWFFRIDRDVEIVSVLEEVANQGEVGAMSGVVNCLFSPSPEVKTAAFRAIHRLLDRIPPERLQHLSDMVGESWCWFTWDAWDRVAPAGVHTLITEEPSRSAVLGLLSFHRNGYVRHEAIRLLARCHDGSELPYLLIRQNDWVEPIRADAHRAVQARLDESYLPHLVTNLPLVVHLLAYRRQDHTDLVRRVIGMLVQPKHDDLLLRVIHSENPTVRRSVVRLALEGEGEHRPRVVKHAFSSTDGVIRLWGSRHIRPCFSGKVLEGILGPLRRDRFMPVRREALIILADTSPDFGRGVWRKALLDGNVSIRELARFHLGKLGEVCWPEVYRLALIEQPQSLVALNGLGETGDQSDLMAIRGCLNSPLPSRRRAAVRAFATLGGESVVRDILGHLQDDSPAVIREVRKHLEAFPSALDGEWLCRVAMEDHRQQVRETALRLIYTMGKWTSLPWLIRASVNGDRSTAELAQELIEAWFMPPGCNRVFTRPSNHERQAILEALDDSRPEMEETFLRKLDVWLKES